VSAEILALIDFDKPIWWEHWLRSGSSSGEHPKFTKGILAKEVFRTKTIVSLYYSFPIAIRGVDQKLAAEQCLLARAKSRATDLAQHPEWLE
jgi:hypothetical protein